MSLFVVFEGLDGAGKTTQARALARRLRRRGRPVLLTREPGGTPLGEAIRRRLKRGGDLSPFAELSSFIAARAQLVQEVVRPALEKGIMVVSDRYTASTVAYQGYGNDMDLELIDRMNQAATGGLSPALTVLLDLPPEVSLSRKRGSAVDPFESAPLAFHRKVREGYLAQADRASCRWLVLDAAQPHRELSRQIWAKIQPLL